jgi:hypothetical protein
LLALWHTDTDQFDEGQWLKARIYERRCDLSPDGKLLTYFAANHKQPYYSWTAISKPPFLTALALWSRGGVLKELSEANLVIDLRDRSFKGVAPPSPYSL